MRLSATFDHSPPRQVASAQTKRLWRGGLDRFLDAMPDDVACASELAATGPRPGRHQGATPGRGRRLGPGQPGLETWDRIAKAEFLDFVPDSRQRRFVFMPFEGIVHPSGKLHHLRLAKAARGRRRGAQADT